MSSIQFSLRPGQKTFLLQVEEISNKTYSGDSRRKLLSLFTRIQDTLNRSYKPENITISETHAILNDIITNNEKQPRENN